MQTQILIDSREKQPLIFKGFETETVMLPTADYTLRGMEHILAIEFKRSVQEFATNTMQKADSARFRRELDRLKDFKYKYVVLAFSYDDIVRYPYTSSLPAPIKSRIAKGNKSAYYVSCFSQLLVDYPDIQFLFAGSVPNAQRIIISIVKQLTPSN